MRGQTWRERGGFRVAVQAEKRHPEQLLQLSKVGAPLLLCLPGCHALRCAHTGDKGILICVGVVPGERGHLSGCLTIAWCLVGSSFASG